MLRRDVLKGAVALTAASTIPVMANQPLFVPPEEDRHEATFMMWPVSRKVHPDGVFLDILQRTIADIANAISDFEPVIMLADKRDHTRARKLLGKPVDLWNIPTEDLWARDAGPLFAKRGDQRVISHIQFNGWGKKQAHKRDGRVAAEIAKTLDMSLVPSGLIGEAGGVEHDGHGHLMAHASNWVNKNRNPGLSRDQIEERLLNAYGASKMIWSNGVYGKDITDYHIDSLARFTGPRRVLINLPDDPDMSDPFHAAAFATFDDLVAAGLDVQVIAEPNKQRIKSFDFVASYANYYACNGAVIASQFGDRATDKQAVRALKQHYPDREIITLNVDALGEVGGGIHCATQPLPA